MPLHERKKHGINQEAFLRQQSRRVKQRGRGGEEPGARVGVPRGLAPRLQGTSFEATHLRRALSSPANDGGGDGGAAGEDGLPPQHRQTADDGVQSPLPTGSSFPGASSTVAAMLRGGGERCCSYARVNE